MHRLLGKSCADHRTNLQALWASLGHTLADPLCAACWATPPRLAAIRGCFRYNGSARDLVLAFKHGDGLQLTTFLTRLMARLFIGLVQDDTLVVPIPLHRRRYYRRRYNQAAELARHLCAVTGLSMFAPHMLIRRRATWSQVGLSRHQRMRNVTGAFGAGAPTGQADSAHRRRHDHRRHAQRSGKAAAGGRRR